MSEPIISVSGLRGIIGDSLTPQLAMRFAAAFVRELPAGPIVVSRDGRATGRMLSAAICSGLNACGRDAIDADILATPTTGVLIRSLNAAGGIQVSASHNPSEYNGMKLFSAEGRVLTAAAGEGVIEHYKSGEIQWVRHADIGQVLTCDDSISEHLRLVLKAINVERIRSRQFRVLLDSNHGAGSVLGRRLLDELGCETTILGDEPNGQFAHQPEPTAENLAGVCAQVTENNADIGFCQDPDADRLAVIDEGGRYVGEEYTLAICLDHVLRERRGPIVTNCATSRMCQDLAIKNGVEFYRAAVGEANVVDMMLEHSAVFGGEGNGGPIDPNVGYVRDSFVGMALILDAMASREQKISELVDELPCYAIHKTKVPLDRDKIQSSLEALEKHNSDASPDRSDGLRLDWSDKWLLVRASNTEPILRLIAEAKTQDEAVRLCDDARTLIAT